MKKTIIFLIAFLGLGFLAYYFLFVSSSNFKLNVENGDTRFTVTVFDGDQAVNYTGVTSINWNLMSQKNYYFTIYSPGFMPSHFNYDGETEKTIILVPLSQAKAVDYLVIYNPSKLSEKYGSQNNLSKSIERLSDSLEIQGFTPNIVRLNSSSPSDLKKQVKDSIISFKPDYVLLIGGDDSIPFYKVSNPLIDDTGAPVIPEDDFVLSDNPYSLSQDPLKPSTPAIGRIIDPSDNKGQQEFAKQIESLAKKNKIETGMLKLISKDTEKMYEAMSGQQLVSPTFTIGSDKHDKEKVKVLVTLLQGSYSTSIVALHGNIGSEPQFFLGKTNVDDSGLLVLDSELPLNFSLSGKVFLSDSCYGASPTRPTGGSIPVNLIISGAKAFIGSTETSYSSTRLSKDSKEKDFIDAGVTNALIYFTKKYYEQGIPIGKALNLAKEKLDLSLSINRLTSLEYVLLGRPDWTNSN